MKKTSRQEEREEVMMKVWEVGVSDCESSHTICVCATKEIALREMFKKRDELVAEWKEHDEYSEKSRKEWCEKEGKEYWEDDMYQRMIEALSSDDYKNWDNYPHDRPWICETEIIDN